jgi:hypothetical protein
MEIPGWLKWPQTERGKLGAAAVFLLVLALLLLGRGLWPPAGQVVGEGYDMRGAYYLWHDTVHTAVREGRLPFWDPYEFSGYPFLVNPQVGAFYPPAWLTVVLPTQVGISWYIVAHLWLAGLGMLLFVRAMGGRWLGGLLAAVAFAFSAFMTARIWAGHAVPLASNIWLPWLALGLAWSVRRGTVWAAVLAGVPLAMAVLAGHTTSLLYMGLGWGAFALYLLVTAGKPGLVIRQAAVMGVVGVLLSAVQLLPLFQFSALSTRVAAPSFEFAANYSLPPAHLITLIVPEYFGEPVRAGYWSVPTFVELTAYAGILPLLGLVLALRRPTRLAWFYVVVIAVGLLLAVGSYGFLYRIFFDLLPPFRLARAPGRAAILYVFAVSALLGEAMGSWQGMGVEERVDKLRPYMRTVLVVAAVIGAAVLAATGAVFAAQHPTETSGRLWHQLGGWSLALTWTLVGGGLLWGYLVSAPEQVVRRRWLGAGLLLVMVADLWFFGYKMVRTSPTTAEPMWADARELIGETNERILPWGVSLFWQNGPGQVGLRSVFGYNSLEIADYEAFVASIPDPRATTYDILGTAYVVSPVALEGFGDGERPLTPLANTESVWVYRRGRVMPVAWLVYGVEVIEDAGATIGRIHEEGFDPATTVVLDQEPPCSLDGGEGVGTAEIVVQRPGYWQIETNSDRPALLVLSETAYPGWQVRVDGEAAEVLKAYSVVRAVCVPAGTHTVEWEYRPTIFMFGGVLSLLGLAAVAMAVVKERRSGRD